MYWIAQPHTMIIVSFLNSMESQPMLPSFWCLNSIKKRKTIQVNGHFRNLNWRYLYTICKAKYDLIWYSTSIHKDPEDLPLNKWYPLVNLVNKHAYGRSPFVNRTTHYNSPFQWPFWHNQRVTHVETKRRGWDHTVVADQDWSRDAFQAMRVSPIHQIGLHRDNGPNGVGNQNQISSETHGF